MRPVLIAIVIILVSLGVGGLLLLGPFKSLLPFGDGVTSENAADDAFRADRGGLSGGSGTDTGPSVTDQSSGVQTVSIAGYGGATVSVQSFLNDTKETSGSQTVTTADGVQVSISEDASPVFYLLTTDVEHELGFAIKYLKTDDSFTIVLLKEPIKEMRLLAQDFLLKKLSIGNTDACVLRYAVLLTPGLNAFYGGRDLGFSFCPGAIAL